MWKDFEGPLQLIAPPVTFKTLRRGLCGNWGRQGGGKFARTVQKFAETVQKFAETVQKFAETVPQFAETVLVNFSKMRVLFKHVFK